MKKHNQGLRYGCLLSCLLAWGLSGLPAMAQVQPISDRPETAVKQNEEAGRWLMTQMGLLESLRQMPEQLELGLQQAQAQGMPPELAKLVLRSGREVYNLKQLEPQALALLLKSLDPEHLQAWTVFYETPLGQKVALADIEGNSARTTAFVFENAPKIMAELATDSARLALVQSVVDATQFLDRAVAISMTQALAMEWAMVSAMPEQPGKPTFRELQDHVTGQRFVVRGQMAQLVLAHTAHVHKDLTTVELQQLLAQALSPSGQALFRDFGQAFEQWMKRYAQRLGQSISQALNKQGA